MIKMRLRASLLQLMQLEQAATGVVSDAAPHYSDLFVNLKLALPDRTPTSKPQSGSCCVTLTQPSTEASSRTLPSQVTPMRMRAGQPRLGPGAGCMDRRLGKRDLPSFRVAAQPPPSECRPTRSFRPCFCFQFLFRGDFGSRTRKTPYRTHNRKGMH